MPARTASSITLVGVERHGRVQQHELAEFLRHYVETKFDVRRAAQRIGRDPRTIYRHLDKNEQFRQAYEEVKAMVGDDAFAEAYRRAVDGVDKPVYQARELVGYVREYSDSLLRDILRATRPEVGLVPSESNELGNSQSVAVGEQDDRRVAVGMPAHGFGSADQLVDLARCQILAASHRRVALTPRR